MTQEEIQKMAESNPKEAAAHSDCPPELWRKLAIKYTQEAKSNPAAGLFALQNPELYSWEAVERACARDWIGAMLPTVPSVLRGLWAADCAERTLGLFEQAHPEDQRPRAYILAWRQYLAGLGNRESWVAAMLPAQRADWRYLANYEAPATAKAAIDYIASNAANRVWTEPDEPNLQAVFEIAYGEAMEAEAHWQWQQLLRYLKA